VRSCPAPEPVLRKKGVRKGDSFQWGERIDRGSADFEGQRLLHRKRLKEKRGGRFPSTPTKEMRGSSGVVHEKEPALTKKEIGEGSSLRKKRTDRYQRSGARRPLKGKVGAQGGYRKKGVGRPKRRKERTKGSARYKSVWRKKQKKGKRAGRNRQIMATGGSFTHCFELKQRAIETNGAGGLKQGGTGKEGTSL